MNDIVELVGPNQALAIFGVKLVGANAENAKKLLFTIVFVVVVLLAMKVSRALVRSALSRTGRERVAFWSRQGLNLFAAVLLLVGITSIWFDDPTRLATAMGLLTAGLAFALQKVITAMAGYIVILRGKIFNVGDRIAMGGVRGDVIALAFTQTTILEMGQPPPVQQDEPAMWVRSRQYTGRVVTVSNARIFDEPVYNYTRDLPYLWEELQLPISYGADWQRAERILLESVRAHSVQYEELSQAAIHEMRRRYVMESPEVAPRVYVRLTDNWIELTARFIAREHGVREQKDQIGRQVLQSLEQAGIAVASTTLQVLRAERRCPPRAQPAVR